MKIFISWSGDKSKQIASVFNDWIPAVIQAVKPYFSPGDIDKGARWANEIAKELEASEFGLIFLTSDNLQAPWLMFEAGALSKSMGKALVCPMLFGVKPTDLVGPLVQFQAAPFSKDEVHKVVKTINAQVGESALEPPVLDSVFEKWWPELDEKVKEALAKEPKKSGAELRSDRELLEEVLNISRTLYVPDTLPVDLTMRIIEREMDITSEIFKRSSDCELLNLVLEHFHTFMFIAGRHLPSPLEQQIEMRKYELGHRLYTKIKELQGTPI